MRRISQHGKNTYVQRQFQTLIKVLPCLCPLETRRASRFPPSAGHMTSPSGPQADRHSLTQARNAINPHYRPQPSVTFCFSAT